MSRVVCADCQEEGRDGCLKCGLTQGGGVYQQSSHRAVIDEYSQDGTGWARFSADRRFRYRLARSLRPRVSLVINGSDVRGKWDDAACEDRCDRIVFLMLNPSTADAFKVDPTVGKCREFAREWGGDVLEVVNLFALRSSDPKVLYATAPIDRGCGLDADDEILAACKGATRVIAAWGTNGWLQNRGKIIRDMLSLSGVRLLHLGLTGEGYPTHPLARGKGFIPLTREPVPWVYS